ncbi:MAG TPA: hypothetical protein VMM13_09540, partial [Euzebya sp.]|nr:hypothetical protein [Euzebya sp.]
MSDIETRVDQAFATAVADQVSEQREIRRLVSRVDEGLVALSDGLVDLSGRLSGTVQQLAADGVTPDDLQRVRDDLADAIGRVDDQIGDVVQRVGDNAALEELRGLMSTTRIDLIESMARLERGAAPVAEAVDETRRDVLRALERLGQSVDSTRDAGWIEAIDRLDAVVGAFERRQLQREDAGEDALQGLQAEAEAALVALRDATEQRLVESVEHVVHPQLSALGEDTAGRTAAQLTDDIGRTVNALAREAAADAASQSVGLAEQIAREAARDAVAAMTVGAETLSDHAAAQVAQAAEHAALAAADRVIEALTQTGHQLHEDLSHTAGVMDATASQTAEALQRLDRRTTDTVSQVETVLRGTATSIEERMHELAARTAAGVIDLTAETTARSEELAALLERLGQVTDSIDPHVRGVAEGVSGSLAELLERHQAATAQSIEQALAVMVRHNGEALEDLRASVQDAVGAETEQVTRALDTMAEVSTTISEGVMDAVARATEQLSATHQAGAAQLQAVTRDLQQLPDDVRGPVLALLTQMQEGVAAVVADLSTASASMADRIQPTIREAMGEAHDALTTTLEGTVSESSEVLRSVQAEVAAELRSAVADLTGASEQARSSVEQSLAAVTGSLQGTLEGQLQGLLSQLAASGQDQQAHASLLRETAQQMAEQLQASWELGSDTMQATTESARQQLTRTAEELVARLEASGSDATSGLASRVDGASARVDDASARITDALERLDAAGASLTRQLADAGQVVASQFTGDVESATARLRRDLDTALASTAERLATTGEAAAEALSAKVTNAGNAIDRAVTSIEEATRTSASTAADVRSTGEQMGQLLTAAG